MTQKPLLDLIPDILVHIRKHEETLQYNLRLYRVLEGQIRAEIESSMRKEIISPPALRRALQRVPTINILKKTVDKLSKVYAEPVTRLTEKDNDQRLMDNIVKISGFDSIMMSANVMLNLSKMAAIEPFVQDGKQHFRVLGGHQFLPFSDDVVNPMNMTVMIKLIGKKYKNSSDDRSYIHDDGLLVTDEDDIKQVDLFQLFTDKEIIIIDSDGALRLDEMAKMGLDGSNPIGIIPHVYLNKSRHELVPFPDTSGLDVSILVPKLLADLNYAAQFMSHSIIWTKNADLGNQDVNPDSVVDLGDTGPDGGDPQMGTIDPKVDIAGVLSLIEFEMSSYFSTIGIKSAGINNMLPGREASGIAKAMDEGDTSAELKSQTEYFRAVEQRFWDKFTKIQEYWSDRNLVKENRKFSPNFSENFSILFRELKVIESSQEKVLRIQAQKDLGIIDRRSMIKEFNPGFSEDQITERLKQVDADKEEAINKMIEMGGGLNGQAAAKGPDNITEESDADAEGSSGSQDNQSDQGTN